MSLQFCMILFILCFISHGQSSKGGLCSTRQVTETSMYAFVGGTQFPNAPYWEQTALQEMTDSFVDKTAEDCQVGNGTSYRGTVSVTKTGQTCQRWDSQTPHEHDYTSAHYPSGGLEQNNHCRNPAGNAPGVWCYTTEKGARWDFCDLPVCGCAFKPGGSDYRGNLSMTRDGKTCQRWDSDYPHNHSYQPEDYPELVENYCRNPRRDEDPHEFTIWCYTTDPSTRWEYCIDPRCPGG
ncbi:hypothetical protein Bbelb_286210 [Branchiostoma belcheri]|nr:hypothetical protein Bbelb_286210 [Branchiostoma belcheri]